MKKYLYLVSGLALVGIIAWICLLLNNKTDESIFICSAIIIVIFGVFAYNFFGVFVTSIFGKKIKGTIIKETKEEHIVDGNVLVKYRTQYAFLNKKVFFRPFFLPACLIVYTIFFR